MKGIKDFEEKGGCLGKHTLSYGGYSEHQEALELEKEVKEPSTAELEKEWEEIKKDDSEKKK